MLAIILYIIYFDRKRRKKLVISLLGSILFLINFNVFINLKKCPDCYGDELCIFIENRQIQLTWFGYVLIIFNPKFTKCVFHAVFNKTQAIVLKRKSRRSTQENFKNLYDVRSHNEIKTPENVILCPGFRNKMSLFKTLGLSVKDKTLWLDLNASIEPLLLLYFQSLGKLPFPKYLGACGDLIAEEYKGIPLINFLHSDFETKALLAAKLLKIAHAFTFESPDFIFYFTDISYYNLVVDSNGDISLIDLDNIIIFDKHFTKGIVNNNVHTSEIFEEYDYAFSATDICNHYLSDHNYFSVCVHLLMQPEHGLLKSIPKSILNANQELQNLLNECAKPNIFSNRIVAGKMLENALEKISQNYSWKLNI